MLCQTELPTRKRIVLEICDWLVVKERATAGAHGMPRGGRAGFTIPPLRPTKIANISVAR